MTIGVSLTDVPRAGVWDAVIIGAGPAGTVAARQLALQGRQVLLLEKARLPRDKVCGGCLGGAALDALQSIGLGHLLVKLGGVRLRTLELASGGVAASIPIGRRIAVSRVALDEALVREAVKAGVTFCDQTAGSLSSECDSPSRSVWLRSRDDSTRVRAKVVFVATGLAAAQSPFKARIAPSSRIGLGVLVKRAQCLVPIGALRMACSSSGYVGLTAVEGDQVDVAAAVAPQALAGGSPGSLINRMLEQAGFPLIRDADAVRWRGTPLLTRRVTPLGGYRCLVIGDAAGYVEPFTGEGIGWAMQSAMLASSLVAEQLESWAPETGSAWTKLYQRTLGHSQRSCHIIGRLLRSATLRQLALWGLRRAPALSQPVVRRLDRPMTIPVPIHLRASGNS